MKRVSFKVAKTIKEAGYPQCITGIGTSLWYTENGEFTDGCLKDAYIICPTYLEVWLWLWREKKFSIDVDCYNCDKWTTDVNGIEFDDPEKAIIAAIEYLVENDLIK